MKFVRSALAALALCCAPVAAQADPGAWIVSQEISPLTNAEIWSASLKSSNEQLNQIGNPDHAALVLRCREGTPAFYVSWPQVLSHDSKSVLLELPETMVLERIDNGPITSDFWVLSNDGTAAGSFDRVGAPRLIASVAHAKKLVVRMTGRSPQDAVFDLEGIATIAETAAKKCGLNIPGVVTLSAAEAGPAAAVAAAQDGHPWGATNFGAAVSAKADPDQARAFADLRAQLVANGWTVVTEDAKAGHLITGYRDMRMNTSLVDCGKMFGIPYIMDARAKTQILLDVTVTPGATAVRTGVRGYYAPAHGNPDEPLTCTPKRPLLDPPYALPAKRS